MSEKQRIAMMWLIVALIFFLGLWACRGSGRYTTRSYPKQGSGAKLLIEKVQTVGAPKIIPVPIRILSKFYFAATALDGTNESVYSEELVWTNLTKESRITLGWDRVGSPTDAFTYRVYRGRSNTNYQAKFSAGTNLMLEIPLYFTNLVVTIIATNKATNIAWSSTPKGPWTNYLNSTNWSVTNPVGIRFFRSMSRTSGSKVSISSHAE